MRDQRNKTRNPNRSGFFLFVSNFRIFAVKQTPVVVTDTPIHIKLSSRQNSPSSTLSSGHEWNVLYRRIRNRFIQALKQHVFVFDTHKHNITLYYSKCRQFIAYIALI